MVRRSTSSATRRRAVLAGAWATSMCALAWAMPGQVASRATAPAAAVTGSSTGAAVALRPADSDTAAGGVHVETDAPLRVLRAVPGTTAQMRFRVRNDTGRAAVAAMELASLVDVPGPGGGALSQHLVLDVRSGDRGPAYHGTIAGVGRQPLGAVPPQTMREWTLVVSFPDGGRPSGPRSGDNAYQGARVDVTYAVDAR